MDLFEVMRGAGSGRAFDTLARHYGVEPADIERAVQGMMPAFSAGLRRSTADPAGLFDFLRALSSGRHATYYDDPGRAFDKSGINEGNAILGHLFGSKEVSRAVADQVREATGLAEAMLKEMLPVLASMVLGGLVRQGRDLNPMLGDLLSRFGEDGAPSGRGRGRGPLDRYEDEQEEREAEEAREARRAREAPDVSGGDSFGGTASAAGKSGNDVFGELFEPGRRMGEAYQRNMEMIFDRYLSGMERRR